MQNNNLTINRKALLKYLEKEQVAFQFDDGLIVFTQPETNVYEYEYDEEAVKDMKYLIEHAENIRVVKAEDVIVYNPYPGIFNDFAKWTIPTDLLIQIEQGLLICLPNRNTYNEIFENAV